MLKPIPSDSKRYTDHKSAIERRLRDIQEGLGTRETEFGENGVTQLGLLPLHWFNFYIKNGEYPHPSLLLYLSKVFGRVLSGERLDSAFGLSRKRGRPDENDLLAVRTTKEFAALEVWQLINSEGYTVEKAVRAVANKYHLGTKTVERAYYDDKAELDLCIDLASKVKRNSTD